MKPTGFKDKNGKDILEGSKIDLFKESYRNLEVRWCEGTKDYWLYREETDSTFWDGYLDEHKAGLCEVK